ncbi:ribosomal-protein-alanine N-acetyltransferase [Tenacibaculum sp. MAR_2010_89]|uniref:GNAT family N-acetyltransferase n=1 Tax=Tenacibaculum sp. MAR_2010_89 TaxID=1250198 RepID=UPI00089D48DA|nr:GNAT family N-acetyltransferase [Tenacibaculum sp. MAR_2010_89]SEE60875.1 ribosomal-protein-alanine N-acetyltransferase [Tenacibaculum sp. MAR_2010_89]
MKELFNPFPILKTERLVLRKLVDSDQKATFEIRSNKEVNKFIDRPVPKRISDIEDFIKMIDQLINANKGVYWAIEYNNILIGSIGLRHFNEDFTYAEVGYELQTDFQGKGFMSEALKEVLNYGFNKLLLNEIEAYTHKKNKNSISLLKKHNFNIRSEKKDVDFENNIILGLIKTDYNHIC